MGKFNLSMLQSYIKNQEDYLLAIPKQLLKE